MPIPALDQDQVATCYKKAKPVTDIEEQGLIPDPEVMRTLFNRLFAASWVPLGYCRMRLESM